MNKPTSRSRRTFQEQVFNQLGQDICSGRYASGELLPSELELCERFGLSRIVIREAIKSLAAKGLIEVRRKVGTLILTPDSWSLFDPDIIAWRANTVGLNQELLCDLMELRRLIEPAAARLAAVRATAEERLALREAYLGMEAAAVSEENGENGEKENGEKENGEKENGEKENGEKENGANYIAADLAFHTAILRACGNQFIKQMQTAFGAILRTSFNIISQKPGGPLFSLPLHKALYLAIDAGEPLAAEQAVIALIEQAEIDLNDCLISAQENTPSEKKE